MDYRCIRYEMHGYEKVRVYEMSGSHVEFVSTYR